MTRIFWQAVCSCICRWFVGRSDLRPCEPGANEPLAPRSAEGLGGAVSPSSGRALVRYWPVLVRFCCVVGMALGRFSHLTLLLRAAPLCTIGLSCCLPPLSWTFFGPRLLPLLASRAAAFHSFGPRPCALLASPAAFLQRVLAIHILLLWTMPLCTIGLSCCFPLLSMGWPFYSYLSLLPCAIGQSCCLPPLSSAWFFFRPPRCCGLGGMFSCILTRGTSGLQPDASPIVDTFGGFWVPAVLRLPFVSS